MKNSYREHGRSLYELPEKFNFEDILLNYSTLPSRRRSGSSYIPCISVSPVDANIQIFELQI